MARGGRQDAGIPRAARWRVGGSRGVAAPYPEGARRGATPMPPPASRHRSWRRVLPRSWEQAPRSLRGNFVPRDHATTI